MYEAEGSVSRDTNTPVTPVMIHTEKKCFTCKLHYIHFSDTLSWIAA